MLWNWNIIDSCFIARSWRITSTGMFAGACVGVVFLVFLLEALRRSVKEYDRYIVKTHIAKYLASVAPDEPASSSDASITAVSKDSDASQVPPCRPTAAQQAVRALLHVTQFAIAYFIMLVRVSINPVATPTRHTDRLRSLPCITTATLL